MHSCDEEKYSFQPEAAVDEKGISFMPVDVHCVT